MRIKVHVGPTLDLQVKELDIKGKHLTIVVEDEESAEIISLYSMVDHSLLPEGDDSPENDDA